MSKFVVDTHALVWYLEANSRLSPAARAALGDPASELFLPIVALAEACWMVEHGRTRIPTVDQLLTHVDADERITLVSLDRAILDRSVSLTAIGEMHDRQILATALLLATATEGISLITRDENIRLSGLIPVVW
jgi:PIN domain nuclease of toxin-antitoxin system